MSFFNIFGKPKTKITDTVEKPVNVIDVIGDLRTQVGLLRKRRALLEEKMELCFQIAREKADIDKKAALFELNKKKILEEQGNKLLEMELTIETQILSIESAAMNKQTVNVLKKGKMCLQKTNDEADVDKVTDLLDDIHEQVDATKSISEALARPIMDEDEDVMSEFEGLLRQTEGRTIPQTIRQTIELPDVPTNHVIINNTDYEKELKQLADSMH